MNAAGGHPSREGRFLCRGAELVYDDTGEGPLAVYAHGGFASRAAEDRMGLFAWGPVLDAGQRLVRYDARGHGRSGGAPVDADFTYQSLAGDLLALLDHLDAREPVAALGASMGCGTVLSAAVRAPERFSRLVLILPPTAWATREAYARANRSSADVIEHEGLDAWSAPRSREPRPAVVADVPPVPPTPAERLMPAVLRGLALSDLPSPAAVAELGHPSLVLAWAGDPGHPLSTAETLARSLPGGELHVARTRGEIRGWAARIAAFLVGSR